MVSEEWFQSRNPSDLKVSKWRASQDKTANAYVIDIEMAFWS